MPDHIHGAALSTVSILLLSGVDQNTSSSFSDAETGWLILCVTLAGPNIILDASVRVFLDEIIILISGLE